jgi:N-methylhydantoinase B
VREYVNLSEARFTLRSTKHLIPPQGIRDGESARGGKCTINPGTDKAKELPSRYSDYPLQENDVFRIETPGGGGFGNPLKRDPARVLRDVREGYVTPEQAAAKFGVVVTKGKDGWHVDETATAARRLA